MTVIEMKEKLIAQINSIDDQHLLEDISHNIELALNNGVYQLSPEQIEAIEEGLAQLKNGQWISHEEATKEIEEWLKK